ncbi:cytochrome P450 [Russula aff. rugulosa BPL654]|nr:cytochrome P450 [Russula aff. rugulosa BPL654]
MCLCQRAMANPKGASLERCHTGMVNVPSVWQIRHIGLKGATIIPNAWCFGAILHDPEIYLDPEEFKPERFLNEDGSIRDDPTLSLAFGVGKRICPGHHLAEAIIFTLSRLSSKDQSGNKIPVKGGVSTERRVVVHLEEFRCSVLPRDEAAENLILENASR